MRCDTRSRFLWRNGAVAPGPLVKISLPLAFTGSGSFLFLFFFTVGHIYCLLYLVVSLKLDESPTESPSTQDRCLGNNETKPQPQPDSEMPDSDEVCWIQYLLNPFTEMRCDTSPRFSWGPLAFPLWPIVSGCPSPSISVSGTFIVCFSQSCFRY